MSNKPAWGFLLACACNLASAQNPQLVANVLPQSSPIIPTANIGMGMMTVNPTPLKFRDSSKPLTIGEMSDMAAQKAKTEFLQRQGYSNEAPAKPFSTPKVKPTLSIQALASWGGTTNQAEILINGRLLRVKGGESLAPGISIESVSASAITLAIVESSKIKSQRKATTQLETTFKVIKVGQGAEILL